MKQIRVKSLFGEYNVYFSGDFGKTIKEINKKNSHLLIDRSIWGLYKKKIGNDFKSIKIITASESNKNLKEVVRYAEFLLQKNVHKNQNMIVIGGGITQDIGSFTAHILLRGMNWIFVPTTLLAMADSCIGSKSGINVGVYKNQVGSFHPPNAAYICSEFIKTLPQGQLINGLGEIIKHAFIKGNDIFKNIISEIENINNKRIAEKIIYESLQVKKEFVEKDELEKNIRKILNYGHTFGHAIEGYSSNTISHGGAVILGMDIANYISFRKRMLKKSEYLRMNKILKDYFPLKFRIKNVPLYMKFLQRDKKATSEGVSAILSRGIGKIEIVKIKFDKELRNAISDYIKES